MSQVAIGPPLVVDGPLPVARPYELLSVVQIVDEVDSHWMTGGAVYGYPPNTPETFDPCSTGTFRAKSEGVASANPVFGAFTAYLPITCSAMGIVPETFDSRARLAYDATESFAYEQELLTADTMVFNPFLDDANVTLLAGGAAVTPAVGLSYLEDAIAETGRTGLIHATPGTATSWTMSGGGNGVQSDGQRLRTVANGTPVAAGGGYIGGRPTGGSAAAAGQAWAYATGPVQIRMSPIEVMPGSLAEALDREMNVVTYRAERHVLLTWDTELQVAVLIDWSP